MLLGKGRAVGAGNLGKIEYRSDRETRDKAKGKNKTRRHLDKYVGLWLLRETFPNF